MKIITDKNKLVKGLRKRKSWLVISLQTVIAIGCSIIAASQATWSQSRVLNVTNDGTTQSGRLYFSPASSSVALNQASRMDIVVDTGGTVVNSVGMDITFPPNLIMIDSLNFSRSVCSVIIEQVIDQASGNIKLSCGLPFPGVNTQTGNVASLNYRTRDSVGQAQFSFNTEGTSILANDGLGTNVLRYALSTNINVGQTEPSVKVAGGATAQPSAQPSATPVVSRSSTPTPTTQASSASKAILSLGTSPTPVPAPAATGFTQLIWTEKPVITYSDSPLRVPIAVDALLTDQGCFNGNKLTYYWLQQEGIKDYNYQFNNSPDVTTNVTRTNVTSMSFDVQTNQNYYLHLRSAKNEQIGPWNVLSIRTCSIDDNNLADSLKRSVGEQSNTFFGYIGKTVVKLFAR